MIDLQQHDYMRQLETAIQFGLPVLLQNVHETLDPSLDPILTKSVIKIGKACSVAINAVSADICLSYWDYRFLA